MRQAIMAMLLLLGVGGCARQPAGGDAAATGDAGRAERLAGEFFSICGTLDGAAIAAQSRALGFVPGSRNMRLGRVQDENARIFVREAGAARAMVRWSARDGECTLGTNDAEPQAAAQAVRRRLEADPRGAFAALTVPAEMPTGWDFAGAYRSTPRPPETGLARLVTVTFNDQRPPQQLVALAVRQQQPIPATPPAGPLPRAAR